MDEVDLGILHHSFFYEPPYFPGYNDVWGNVVVARSAAHPWGAQRLLGYFLLSGMCDRYPNLRIGFAECSAGWLPGWLTRLEGQAHYLRRALPERKHTPLDYARDGRVFVGIEPYEGAEMCKAIIDVCGDGVLMFQSDYPHGQCMFPDTPDVDPRLGACDRGRVDAQADVGQRRALSADLSVTADNQYTQLSWWAIRRGTT